MWSMFQVNNKKNQNDANVLVLFTLNMLIASWDVSSKERRGMQSNWNREEQQLILPRTQLPFLFLLLLTGPAVIWNLHHSIYFPSTMICALNLNANQRDNTPWRANVNHAEWTEHNDTLRAAITDFSDILAIFSFASQIGLIRPCCS